MKLTEYPDLRHELFKLLSCAENIQGSGLPPASRIMALGITGRDATSRPRGAQ